MLLVQSRFTKLKKIQMVDQEERVDCEYTYSPVVKNSTMRIVHSLVVTHGWILRQLDVRNAFLNENLQETIYMKQPPWFVRKERPVDVCLLNKALYGLRQAPRAWYLKL